MAETTEISIKVVLDDKAAQKGLQEVAEKVGAVEQASKKLESTTKRTTKATKENTDAVT